MCRQQVQRKKPQLVANTWIKSASYDYVAATVNASVAADVARRLNDTKFLFLHDD